MMAQIVTSLLDGSTAVDNRIYPLLLPQSAALPAITYQQISRTPFRSMGEDSALSQMRLQVNLWGRTYKEVRELAEETRAVLNRYHGIINGHQVDILFANEIEGYDGETDTRVINQDYMIFISEV